MCCVLPWRWFIAAAMVEAQRWLRVSPLCLACAKDAYLLGALSSALGSFLASITTLYTYSVIHSAE